jgi:hypothetical protein
VPVPYQFAPCAIPIRITSNYYKNYYENYDENYYKNYDENYDENRLLDNKPGALIVEEQNEI